MKVHAQKQPQPQPQASPNSTRSSAKPVAASPTVDSILYLQRTIGNQAVLRLIRASAEAREVGSDPVAAKRLAHDFSQIPPHAKAPVSLQAKLKVNTPGDIYEQEAEAVSEQVMRMPELQLQPACPCGRGCLKCQTKQSGQEQARLQTEHVGSSDSGQTVASPLVHEALASPGQPLDTATRAFMEPRFGHDFSMVQVHSGPLAEQSARNVNANAYTLGHNIVFGVGRFAPETYEGRRLIAHELTHVVQQSGASGSSVSQSYGSHKQIQRQSDSPDQVPMFLDPYADLPLNELKKLAKTNPTAAESLRLRYRNPNMPDKELARLAANGDAMAQSVRRQRILENKPAKNLAKGHAPFSNPEMYDELVEEIRAERVKSGIKRSGPSFITPDVEVEGGVVASAKTNVPGLEDKSFVGKSPRAGGKVNPASEFPPATDPDVLPHTHGHAEQNLADQLSAAFKKVPPENLKGGRVWILVEQIPCSTCASGTANPEVAAGVLRKLSEAYPDVTFEIKNLDSNAVITLRDGKAPPKASAPEVPPKTVTPRAPTGTAVTETAPGKGGNGKWGKGTAGEWKAAGKGAGLFAAFIALGLIHQRGVEKRAKEGKEKTGWAPYGPTGNKLYDVGSWIIDPTDESGKNVGLDQRFDISRWRAHIRKLANDKKPGEYLTMRWQTSNIKEFKVKYRKAANGWWMTISGETDDPPDLNKIIDKKYSDGEVREYLQLPPPGFDSGMA